MVGKKYSYYDMALAYAQGALDAMQHIKRGEDEISSRDLRKEFDEWLESYSASEEVDNPGEDSEEQSIGL
jgi:hypothetical protein